jgi:glycosyltransferase involved in cell wall biosynthesis
VGFAGRLIERKGWKDFVSILKYLKNMNLKLLVVGDGEDKSKLLDFIKKNKLEDKIICLGYIDKMRWFYSLLDCFVISSHWEPMGLTEIEAQAFEVPVIASNVAALNEIINNENGMLFEAKNPNDLSQKINKLYKNQKLRKELVKNGLKNAKKFDLNNYVAKLNQLYHEK